MSNTLGTILFPGSLDTPESLLLATNNAFTTLSVSLPANDDDLATISVDSTDDFPDSGVLSIEDEIFFYESKTADTFQQCYRAQDGTTASAHAEGTIVELRIVAAFHNTHSTAVRAVESKLGSGASVPALGTLLQGMADGTSNWRNHIGIGVAPVETRLLNLAGEFPDTLGAGLLAGAWIAPTFKSSSTGEVYGLQLAPTFASAASTAQSVFYALNSNPNIGSGDTTNITSFANVAATFQQNAAAIGGGVVQTYRGFMARNPTGTGTIANVYGVYVENMTKGTNLNYGIYSQGGWNYFGGATGIGVTPINAARLNLSVTFSDATSTDTQYYGINNIINANYTAAPSSSWIGYGMYTSLTLNSVGNVSTLSGTRVAAIHNGASTVTNHMGINVMATCSISSGTGYSTNVTGGAFSITKSQGGNWSVGTAKVLEVRAPNISGAGTLSGTNLYGLYLGDFSTNVGSWTTGQYAIYAAGGTSYHAGSFGIGVSAPNSPLHVGGAIATTVRTKAVNYTLTATDSVVLATAGSISISLPDATLMQGRRYTIVKTDTSSLAVSVVPTSPQKINGNTSYSLPTRWDRVTVVSDGSDWVIVG